MNALNWFKFKAGLAALASLATLLGPAAVARAASFTAGNLVVERMGDGTTSLSSASTQVSILEVTTAGSLGQTITLATSGSDQQSDSGSASSNGYLNTYFSGTAAYLSVPGYNLPINTIGVASQNAKVNSIFDSSGTIINRTLFPVGGASGTAAGTPPGVSPYSGNNYRSSISTTGSTFYAAGTSSGSPVTGGIWYNNGTSFIQVTSTASGQPTNLRNVEIYGSGANQRLFFTSAATSGTGLFTIGSGLPTSAAQTATLVINTGSLGTSASPYGFVMFSTGSQGAGVLDLAYIADSRSTTGGGLEKWTFNGTSWSNAWWLLLSSTSTALTSSPGVGIYGLGGGLTGSYDSTTSTATLYAVSGGALSTAQNALVSITDNGTTPSSYTTLLTSGSNYVFRGVDFSPAAVPEPGSLTLAAAAGLGIAGLIRRRRRRGGDLDG